MPRVVVVGAGLAGLRIAESLRNAGYAGEVLVVGDEPHAPYNRPPLSKEALAGELTHAAVAFRVRRSAADVQWRLGVRGAAVNATDRRVRLADGAELDHDALDHDALDHDALDYDALVVASGVRPRRLDVPGPGDPAAPHLAGRHVLRGLDDALALRRELRPGARLLVVGAGFIGCEVAATARQLGCDVTCVALDPAPLHRPLGPLLAAELQRRHEAQGVRFHLSTGVTVLEGDERVRAAVLTDGRVLPADVVVEALGTVPNVEWLVGSGLDTGDGVRTDDALRALTAEGSLASAVFAVGDVARFPNPRFDDVPRRIEHWNVPTDTARRAAPVLAALLAGEDVEAAARRPWDLLPSFWSDQYDVRLQSFGLPALADPDGVRVLEGRLDDECVVGYFRGEDLVGVVGIGMLREVMGYREAVGRGRASRIAAAAAG